MFLRSIKITLFCENSIKIFSKTILTYHQIAPFSEYNDYIISVKVVSDISEAISHINEHSTHHSEAIITENYANARRFQQEIDSAAVYVNASTRFTDGGEFGLGAEMGISTQKLHVRGPFALEALTCEKTVISGCGQIR